jgi:hypothetical protein
LRGRGGLGIRLAGMLIRRQSVLIGAGGPFLGRADSALGLLVNLFHLVASVGDLGSVLGSLLTYLVYFRLNWNGRVANVFFGSAATGEQGARYDARGRKESFHSSKPRIGMCNPCTVVD